MRMFSGAAGACSGALAQRGFGPPPLTGLAITGPSDTNTRTCTPLSGIASPAVRTGRAAGAVIVEFAERDNLGQRFEASDMIAMPMANHDMIDFRQARLLRGGDD